jgi:hypothetical protein
MMGTLREDLHTSLLISERNLPNIDRRDEYFEQQFQTIKRTYNIQYNFS